MSSAVCVEHTNDNSYWHSEDPEKGGCEETVNQLASVLDDEEVVSAVKESEEPSAKPINERCGTGAF
jgi:hypothetical protein